MIYLERLWEKIITDVMSIVRLLTNSRAFYKKIYRFSFSMDKLTTKLTLNLLKTEFMIIGSKPKLNDIDETISITIVGEEIYKYPYVKLLGFIIDQNLDWQDHVQAVIKKTSSGLAVLRYTKRYLPFQTLKSLYYTLIECHFGYGNVIKGELR